MLKDAAVIKIRYNTESDGKYLCWRLLVAGEEILVNSIEIKKGCITTTDWLEDKQCFKHHITVQDCTLIIDDDLMNAIVE